MFGSYGILPGDMMPAADDKIIITREKKVQEAFPGFTIFGNGKETRNGGKSMDILDICQELNTAEMNLMKFLRDEVERNKMNKEVNPNRVRVASSIEWTEYLKVAMKKNYSHMKCMQILKREKRGVYMMNPMLFIPAKNMSIVKKEWDEIDG